ncbi:MULTISPECIES: DinB family protein [Bacillaceae]|uniref:DinB family protein n=1 Tax=Bacillaceae TaxID=186817 RepID=UPI001C59E88D|nr:DinB family protein [Rossellomorea sp. YZS02]MBW3111512.1 DinB family protein [Bacillus sp. MCCB 382]MDX8344975.1 DinB family protein [Rossellomorea sp. YZS02]
MKLGLMDTFRMEFDFCWNTEAWFLPLEPALEGLSSLDASWQPPGGGNSIWQTVNHLNYYNSLLVRQVNDLRSGKRVSHKKTSFGDIGRPADPIWKSILEENTFGDTGDSADSENWKEVLAETHLICENVHKSLSKVDESQIQEELVGILARQVLHNAYHIGQIVLLRKQQGSWPKERD